MKQPMYVCATCSQGFTRKSTGKRHNLNLHSGKGCIVRFIDYIVGRLNGRYAEADPLSYRKNNGNNVRTLCRIKHPPSNNTGADSIASAEVQDLTSSDRPFAQERDTSHDFSSLDYSIALARRVLEIESLEAIRHSTDSRSYGVTSSNGTYALNVLAFLTQQFKNECIFGYVGYVCPFCAHFAIYQLEFRGGSTKNRTWFTYHKCDTKAGTTGESRISIDSRYVRACNTRIYYLHSITRAWLKNNFRIFAVKLPSLYDLERGLVEIADLTVSSKSICICISKEEIIDLWINRKHWAGRAIVNGNKPTQITEQEVMDFLHKTEHSTFGIFNVRSADPPGWKSEYFLIYLGKCV
jgi:hypothetical protein